MLQYWRLFVKLSPQELAQRAHLSDRLIKNIEADPHYNIKLNTAKAIADALGIPVFVVFLPDEHDVLNNMILTMLRRQESIFTMQTMVSMLQTLPPHLHVNHTASQAEKLRTHDTQSYSQEVELPKSADSLTTIK